MGRTSRWLLAALGLLGLVAGSVLTTLAVTGGTGSRSVPGTDGAGGDLRLASAGMRPATSCDDLLAQYVERALEEVGPYGWETGPVIMFDASGAARSETAAGAPLPTTTRSTSSGTGTNVQEAGVDEPDAVKVLDDRLVRVQDDVLTVHDLGADEPRLLSTLTLEGMADGELLVSGDRVVVLGAVERGTPGAYDGSAGTRVVVLDVADPGAPRVVSTADLDAELVAARLHGDLGEASGDPSEDVVRLVLRTGLPALDFVQPGPRQDQGAALEHNRQVVRDSTLADWLPTVGGAPVVACGDVAVPTDRDAALATTTVLGFRAADTDPLAAASATGLAADATTSYFSTDRLYLATGPASGWWERRPTIECIDCLPPTPGDGTTDLHAFALDDLDTTYVAGGEVEGSVRDRWAMDVADGTLRLTVTGTGIAGPAARAAPASSVVTLREDGTRLVEVGRVDGLGVGEQVTAVRWFDDLALVVTFRRVDPLYAVDLTDPTAPRLVGELKIPGYSEYLHPLGGRRLLGVGQDAGPDGTLRGAQAALFDVTDLTAPDRLDTVAYPPRSSAAAGTDPRQFTWLPDRRIALTVVADGWDGRTGWVSVMRLGGDRIRNDLVEVAVGMGGELADVRTVPTPDGRVVLVAGDSVSFMPL
ncbi:beta-propeller domain-containing protein [Nocardioides sediminis]|uniref:beta-propeller domain-containing protein n=1 Tax=Nocardioides sediminis TaxID=433648 RepID=UPI000D31D180|nr:beta-propeller domain-containing protein [Nocardioides sediminis]